MNKNEKTYKDFFPSSHEYKNVFDEQNFADINIYYSSTNVNLFYELVAFALSTKKDFEFFYNEPKSNSNFNFSSFKKYLDTKNNIRKYKITKFENDDLNSSDENKKELFYQKVYDIATKNNQKVINVWMNSEMLVNRADVFEKLIKLPNVQINALNESPDKGEYYLRNYYNNYENVEYKNLNFDNKNRIWKIEDFKPKEKVFHLGQKYPNLKVYWFSKLVTQKYRLLNFKNIRPYSEDIIDFKSLFLDEVKDANIFNNWLEVTGISYSTVKKIIENIDKSYKKPNLLFIANDDANDLNYFLTVVKKYHDKFNVFYKSIKDNVTKILIDNIKNQDKEISYYDYISKSNQKFDVTKIKNFAALSTYFPIEELIKNDAENNEVLFEKFFTTSLSFDETKLIINNKNSFEDIIGFIENGLVLSKDSMEDNTDLTKNYDRYLNNFVEKVAFEYISVTLKESQEKTKKLLTKDDFAITLKQNTLFTDVKITKVEENKLNKDLKDIEITFKYNPKNVQNKKEYTIKDKY
ncbi:hypothetical protein [Mycoplasmopsis cynos]|uniref:hypothetical protein n=1 Tax=Mycoplasmopsis cynos TaxID=171284 RepID=UPI00220C240A|nr:hypothetical protein [Mycoplasmopsis cynos]UWV81555.1 hypothetical protein NW065_06675 [Mycoplasmopsis cynos]